MGVISPELRPKLERLIPMLSSNQAGEVTATVAAIGRTLASAGLDWHDLARDVGAEPTPVARLMHGAHKTTCGFSGLTWHPSRRYVVADVLKAAIEDRIFTEWEVNFARSIIELVDQPRGKLSDKQATIVNRLIRKAAVESAS